jgi:glycosyltransferase involved in cell wall biosynthesis
MPRNSSRIKIAILDHSPDLGGAEVATLTLLRNMDRSRFDATVVLPSDGPFSKALEKIGVSLTIIRLPMGLIRLKRGRAFHSFFLLLASFFYLQYYLLRLCIYLKRNRFQLVLTNTVKAHLYGSIAARLCSIPLVWRFHDILVSPDFSPLLIRIIVFFGNLFPKRILAVSRTAQDHLLNCGVESGKTEVIFNAAADERSGMGQGPSDIRQEYGLEEGVKLVGCIGRIVPQKGQKVLLSAIPEVLRRYPDIFFLIVGDIFLKEEAYKNELLEIIRRYGIEEKVKLTGFRPDITHVMGSLDAVVFPSIAPEAFPLSVLEAMSLGKPVVASDIGGVREMIEDRVSGFLVEPGQPEQITERIVFLFEHPEVSDQIRRKAKEVARQDFSLKNYVSSIERACRESAMKEEGGE